MSCDQSDSEGEKCPGLAPFEGAMPFDASVRRGVSPLPGIAAAAAEGESSAPTLSRSYERELIQSVWEFAEVVSGNDAELWRKDEFGDWIYRFDYGRRTSEIRLGDF